MTCTDPSRLAELSTLISKNTTLIDQYLKDNDLPPPTFDAHESVLDRNLPPEIQEALIEVQNAGTEIADLTIRPWELLLKDLYYNVTDFYTIIRLQIPLKIPVDDPNGISYDELFSRLGQPALNKNAIIRILRLAIVHRMFKEPSPGRIAHSTISRLCATDEKVRRFLYGTIEGHWSMVHVGRALEKWPELDEVNHSGASLALSDVARDANDNEYITYYDYLNRDPDRAEGFAQRMLQYQTAPEYDTMFLAEGFDWELLPSGSNIVDVGGSHGSQVIAIARRFPKLKFVVQDLPKTIATAATSVEKKAVDEEGLDISYAAHDFFTPQPVKDAKVYILRWILHNWPDKYCIKILKELTSAMERGSKVVVMDGVMPLHGSMPNTIERAMRLFDFSLLSLFNAGDRDIEHYKDLFLKAELSLQGVTKPEGSRLSIMVATWEG